MPRRSGRSLLRACPRDHEPAALHEGGRDDLRSAGGADPRRDSDAGRSRKAVPTSSCARSATAVRRPRTCAISSAHVLDGTARSRHDRRRCRTMRSSRQLTQVKGIGRWSAEMFLMFRLHRPDVLPVGDLGIVNAIRTQYRLRKRADAGADPEDWRERGSRTGRWPAGISGEASTTSPERAAGCAVEPGAVIIVVSACLLGVVQRSSLLGRRSTVGLRALDAVIGVRIPTSQPAFARPSGELRLGRLSSLACLRRAETASEGCLDEARAAGVVGPPHNRTLNDSRAEATKQRRRTTVQNPQRVGAFK